MLLPLDDVISLTLCRRLAGGLGEGELAGGRLCEGESFPAMNCALFLPFCDLDLARRGGVGWEYCVGAYRSRREY